MGESKHEPIFCNDLVRFMTSRSYYYLYRVKVEGRYASFYIPSPLYYELINLYNSMSKEERSSYVKKDKQKAE